MNQVILPKFKFPKDISLPKQIRLNCRNGLIKGPTANLAPDFVQANLVIISKNYSKDFLDFVLNNPKPCPLLDIIVGDEAESRLAPGSCIKTDLPKYRVWKYGKLIDEPYQVENIWLKGMVGFLLGCSFTWEDELKRLGLLEKNSRTVPMYRTKILNKPNRIFKGKLVVSMRMIEEKNINKVIEITKNHPLCHGEPVAIGWEGQKQLGIDDLNKPDFGEILNSSSMKNVVPIFWACGVTPQSAIEDANDAIKEIVITHAPGCMFVTDVKDELFY